MQFTIPDTKLPDHNLFTFYIVYAASDAFMKHFDKFAALWERVKKKRIIAIDHRGNIDRQSKEVS